MKCGGDAARGKSRRPSLRARLPQPPRAPAASFAGRGTHGRQRGRVSIEDGWVRATCSPLAPTAFHWRRVVRGLCFTREAHLRVVCECQGRRVCVGARDGASRLLKLAGEEQPAAEPHLSLPRAALRMRAVRIVVPHLEARRPASARQLNGHAVPAAGREGSEPHARLVARGRCAIEQVGHRARVARVSRQLMHARRRRADLRAPRGRARNSARKRPIGHKPPRLARTTRPILSSPPCPPHPAPPATARAALRRGTQGDRAPASPHQ
eukprot:scaffold13629_cov101-Isochrysis_galbana.AAC.3